MSPLDQAFVRMKPKADAVRQRWPGDTDMEKTHRAFAGYYEGFIPLLKAGFARTDVLKLLDSSKAFGVSERSIRRPETIRKSSDADLLEALAKSGWWSLEVVEHIAIRGVNTATLEVLKRLVRR